MATVLHGGGLGILTDNRAIAVSPLQGFGTINSLRNAADRQHIIDLLKQCTSLPQGKLIHAHVLSSKLSKDTFISNLLLCMYDRNGVLHDARSVFDHMPHRNIVTWNAMIGAYSKRLLHIEAFQVFTLMQHWGMDPNEVTFVSLLCAFADRVCLHWGCIIHACILSSDCRSNIVLHNALINMYGKCGALGMARTVFNDMCQKSVISWNSMIARYNDHGKGREALLVYKEMRRLGVPPCKQTFLSALGACIVLTNLIEGRAIHANIVEYGLESDVELATTIIDFYGKFAYLLDAWLALSKVQEHDTALWTAILSAYSQQGEGVSALYTEMERYSRDLDQISSMGSCEFIASLYVGLSIHTQILERGFESDITIGNALLHLYGKWGALMDVCIIFRKMRQHNVISWNAFIAAHSQYGMVPKVTLLMHEMEEQRVIPDEITFVCFISACSREGLVEEADSAFLRMVRKHGIMPEMEHYNSIIDVLGRTGRVEEAEEVIHELPFKPDKQVWVTFLSACSLHGESSRGVQAAKSIISISPQSTSASVLLSNIYATIA